MVEQVAEKIFGHHHELLHLAIVLGLKGDKLGLYPSPLLNRFQVGLIATELMRGLAGTIDSKICVASSSSSYLACLLRIHQALECLLVVHAHPLEEHLHIVDIFEYYGQILRLPAHSGIFGHITNCAAISVHLVVSSGVFMQY